MKQKPLFLATLVGLFFAGCSGDDAHENVIPDSGEKYMAVNLVMPANTAQGRAFGDAGFEAGSAAEVGVTSALFLFFDGEVQVAEPFTTASLTWSAVSGTNQSIDQKSLATLVLQNAIKNPTSIVAILNPLGTPEITRSTTLTQLMNITADYSQHTNPNRFVMSNSVYLGSDNKAVVGAPCTDANVKSTPAEAETSPVQIAVERILAKVSVAKATSLAMKTGPGGNATVNVDNTPQQVVAEIDGWWLDNTNSSSYLIKHLATAYTDITPGATWWNDLGNRRSYWATPANGALNHYAYNTANTNDKYCQENTSQQNPTQLVVAATLKTAGAAKTLVQYLGVIYTQDGFEAELTKQISNKYYKEVAAAYTPLTKEDLKFTYKAISDTPTEAYKATVSIELSNPLTTVYTSADGSTYTVANPTSDLAGLQRTIQYWKDGKTYYFLPIHHNEDITMGTGETSHKLYGIIRNHLYKLTINSINGLGTPVHDITKTIIPEKPVDDNSYIAAEIEILKYKVVTQGVDLGL